MSINYSDIINKLKKAKTERGFTNESLSMSSGIPLGTLNKLFSGNVNSIKLDTLASLADILSVGLTELMSGGEERQSDKKEQAKIEEEKKFDFGYIRIAAATPPIKVCDVEYNGSEILKAIFEAKKNGAEILTLPELSLTGYTAQDLFYQTALIEAVEREIEKIAEQTASVNMLICIGAPIKRGGELYNCALLLNCGEILGVVPKINLPNYNEFYEKRHFNSGRGIKGESIKVCGREVPFGVDLLFAAKNGRAVVGVEICEDLWVADAPSTGYATNGATVILNPSASDETIGKAEYRRNLVAMQSAKNICAYCYSDAGDGESTQDMVFAGHNLICENGSLLCETKLFENGAIYADVDISALEFDRIKQFKEMIRRDEYRRIDFVTERGEGLSRKYGRTPFVPSGRNELSYRSELILRMQAEGLKKRIAHTGAKTLVIGVSGGLDSTLALLVCARSLKLLGRTASDIIAVTMPCFGTTRRTKSNAVKLAEELGATLLEIDITKSVRQHFADIGQDENVTDVTFENGQARERTQVLMDLANKKSGMVIGTGDLSELALGFATYNGDHMSMYGVNASVPKTLIRYLIEYEAKNCGEKLSEVLYDILDTPVSPELIPAVNGDISQRTEEIVGPYLLHDFYLYYMLRYGFSPLKLFYIATSAFKDEFSEATMYKWLKTFIKRFFAQQFKRSCLPDGVKIGSITLSPRGDWRMPSDAVRKVWESELETIKEMKNFES